MRRRPRGANLGIPTACSMKRRCTSKAMHGCVPSTALVDEATNDMLVVRLNKEEGRSHRSKGVINKLMDETFTNRRSWITNDRPQVKNVIEKFPSFKDDQCVSSPKLIYAL